MRKQWVAMLSMLGLAGPAVQSQVVKGATNEKSQTAPNNAKSKVQKSQIVSPRDPQSGQTGKLKLKQQNLRRQGVVNSSNPAGTTTCNAQTQTATCNAHTQANKNQLNASPSPTGNNQLTKGKVQGQTGQAGTKVQTTATGGSVQTVGTGNNQLTKAKVQGQTVTGGNNQLTKANNNQINNNAVAK
jgi:hypothetical protein